MINSSKFLWILREIEKSHSFLWISGTKPGFQFAGGDGNGSSSQDSSRHFWEKWIFLQLGLPAPQFPQRTKRLENGKSEGKKEQEIPKSFLKIPH